MLLFGCAGLYAIFMHLTERYLDNDKVPVTLFLLVALTSWLVSWVSGAIFYIAAIVQIMRYGF